MTSQTPFSDVTHYNNFYEFGTGKGDPANNAQNFVTYHSVYVEEKGKLRENSRSDAIMKSRRWKSAFTGTAAWKRGPSLSRGSAIHSAFGKLVEPTAKARFVAFQSYYDVKQMPEGSLRRD